jgi:hypothetical protein
MLGWGGVGCGRKIINKWGAANRFVKNSESKLVIHSCIYTWITLFIIGSQIPIPKFSLFLFFFDKISKFSLTLIDISEVR